ncbi:MAG: hypothetical protein D6744_18840 [Planctomycetota bacterium]|nr:MAG: hypothetical protein D6744_18840 [Planctomycetota bacterium]
MRRENAGSGLARGLHIPTHTGITAWPAVAPASEGDGAMHSEFVWPVPLRDGEPRESHRPFQNFVPYVPVVRTVLVWPPRDRAKRRVRIVVRPEAD